MPRTRNAPQAATSLKSSSKPQPGRAAQRVTTAPVSKTRVVRTSGPKYLQAEGGSVRIRHREFLWDINGSSDFAWDAFNINPGLPETFPWLSVIANRFESYRFHKLRFCYEPVAPTTVPGTAILTVDFDASDEGPETKTIAMSYRSAVRCAPWDEVCWEGPSSDLHKAKTNYVRNGSVPIGTDVKLYDVGVLYAATQGQSSTAAIGELYVEYDVELLTPQMNNAAPSLDLINATGAGITFNAFLGTPANVVVDTSSKIVSNIAYSIPDISTLRFEQAGTFLLELFLGGTAVPTFTNALTSGPGFAKQIGNMFSAGQIANWVVKANRGDLFRPLGTYLNAVSNSRLRITQIAASAA